MPKELKETFDDADYLLLMSRLSGHDPFFREFFQQSGQYWSETIETISVRRENNKFSFHFNKEFWSKLTDTQKIFGVAHEIMHIALDHLYRYKFVDPLENVACDIVVNHMLVNYFGFLFEDVAPIQENGKPLGCWISTVFDNPEEILIDQDADYYLEKIREQQLEKEKEKGPVKEKSEKLQELPPPPLPELKEEPVAESKGLTLPQVEESKKPEEFKEPEPEPEPEPEELKSIEELDETEPEPEQEVEVGEGSKEPINKEEPAPFEQVITILLPGGLLGGLSNLLSKADGKPQIRPQYKKPKPKFESVIKNWCQNNGSKEKVADSWLRPSRHQHLCPGMFIPGTYEVPQGKVDLFFFQDVSGSCAHYEERFRKVAEGIDPSKFNVEFFVFDDFAFHSSEKRARGWGTTFSCIEDKIQQFSPKRYPQAVFIITDGYGNFVYPAFPERWHFFLTEYHYKPFIPPQSKSYSLADYESTTIE